jgi:hypothetical protein
MSNNQIELEGRVFVPACELDMPNWGCVTVDRNQPTLTLKGDDLFLILLAIFLAVRGMKRSLAWGYFVAILGF